MGAMTDRSRKLTERAQLDYPLTAPATDGSVITIAPGLLWVRMPMQGALGHINVYLLEDSDGWWIVDTGLRIDKVKSLWLKLAAEYFSEKPLKAVICTHFHYDHSGQSAWLSDHFQVPVYMTHGEYFAMRVFNSGGADIGSPSQRDFFHRSGVPEDLIEDIIVSCSKDPFRASSPPGYIRLFDQQSLQIGSRQWRIIVGQGHSPEHACLYCEDEGILIAGDQLLPEISSNVLVTDIEPFANPLALWLQSLDRLEKLHQDTLILPAHGPVFKNVKVRVHQLQSHHERQLNVLRDSMTDAQPVTAFQLMSCLFKRKLSVMDNILALGETLAHLNWLMDNHEISVSTDSDGISQYCAK
ncbi:MBL fold metallo-hydrolase [Endozoicomonas sp.]|uniref:MBL fold metallo-hydrolase n=1 Tax=Endozoicomonas sp. TaxID=1892382 RepID=UPI00383BCBB2